MPADGHAGCIDAKDIRVLVEIFDHRVHLVHRRGEGVLGGLGVLDADHLAAGLPVEFQVHLLVHVRAAQDEPAAVQVEENRGFVFLFEAVQQRPGLPVIRVDQQLFPRRPAFRAEEILDFLDEPHPRRHAHSLADVLLAG